MSTPQTEIEKNKGQQGLTLEQVQGLFQQFLGNRGMTAEQGGAQMMFDNYILREKNRQLEGQVAGFQATAPKEGSVVLSKEEGELFTGLKGLLKEGQKPEDLKKLLKEHGELSDRVKTLEVDGLVSAIAEAEGWKPSALRRLTNGMDLLLEEVEEEIDDPEKEGEKKKVKASRGFLNVKDAKGSVTGKKRLSEELAEFLPSLGKDEKGGGVEETRTAANQGQGTKFVRQSQGGKAVTGQKSAAKDFLGKRYAPPKKRGSEDELG